MTDFKTGESFELVNDPADNPGGALLEVFFRGTMPDGTPLSDEEVKALGSGLITALEADPAFRAEYIERT